MAAPFVIIDGYNVMHACGLARAKYGPGDLQRQRHRLLVHLASQMTADERIRCTVVFDAIEAPSGLDRRGRHGEITVMFAEPGHEADELIEALIASHTAARQLVVVSSDHRLQKAAKQRHAESIDSEVFLERLAKRAKSSKSSSASTGQQEAKSGSDDVNFWLNEFGKIDVSELVRSEEIESGAGVKDTRRQELDDLQRQIDAGQNLEEWLDEPRKGRSKRKPD